MFAFLFFIIPLLLIGLWISSLLRYTSAKKDAPGTHTEKEIKKRKLIFILLSVVTGVVVAIVIGFMALMLMAVAYM